ncbi:hypothetical protein NL676_000019 [Syzygium grande]|nr:hypothetical protein NL676_000019 [Syzygium grande]
MRTGGVGPRFQQTPQMLTRGETLTAAQLFQDLLRMFNSSEEGAGSVFFRDVVCLRRSPAVDVRVQSISSASNVVAQFSSADDGCGWRHKRVDISDRCYNVNNVGCDYVDGRSL